MSADWMKIKTEYINDPEASYRKLAAKYGVTFAALRSRAEREQWTAQKTAQQHKINTEAAQRAVEKIAEKISEDASEIAAIKSRLKRRIFEQIELRMSEELDGPDFRRIVQSFKDMCDIKEDNAILEDMVNEDGLSKSLRELGQELQSDEN